MRLLPEITDQTLQQLKARVALKRTTADEAKAARGRSQYGSTQRMQYNEELLDELLARVEVLEAQQAGLDPEHEPDFDQGTGGQAERQAADFRLAQTQGIAAAAEHRASRRSSTEMAASSPSPPKLPGIGKP